jgi:hypothetical protein
MLSGYSRQLVVVVLARLKFIAEKQPVNSIVVGQWGTASAEAALCGFDIPSPCERRANACDEKVNSIFELLNPRFAGAGVPLRNKGLDVLFLRRPLTLIA